MAAVVEDENVPIVEPARGVLVRQDARSPLPAEGARLAIDDGDRARQPEAQAPVAIGQDVDRVGVRPLLVALERADHVVLEREVFPRAPLVPNPALCVDFTHDVAPHRNRIFGVCEAAAHLRVHVLWQALPTQQQVAAVGKSTVGVVHEAVAVLPDDLRVPVELEDGALLGRLRLYEQVTVLDHVRVLDALGMLPALNDPPFGVEQLGRRTAHGGEERIAGRRELGVAIDETDGALTDPGHGAG